MRQPISLVVFTRDRHPSNHCSFTDQGGAWPIHCVDETWGFSFHPRIPVPREAMLVDKATSADRDAYSGFDGTALAHELRQRGIRRCVVCGLATDYCVRATVLDALKHGFDTCVLTDAIAGVDARPGDSDRALIEMRSAGAILSDSGQIQIMLEAYPEPTALLIVDAQNDFFPGGALPVEEAHRILDPVFRLVQLASAH